MRVAASDGPADGFGATGFNIAGTAGVHAAATGAGTGTTAGTSAMLRCAGTTGLFLLSTGLSYLAKKSGGRNEGPVDSGA